MSTIIESSVSQLEQHKSTLNILRTITKHNESGDARVLTVEGDLATVRGLVTTFIACLQGLRTNTEMATSALRTDVNDLWARIIPDLHRDLQTEIQASVNTMIQGIDITIQETLVRLPDVLQGSSSHPPPADTTEVHVDDIHTTDRADGPLTDGIRATDPTLQSTTRGGDNVNTADAPAHGVGFQHLWSPYRGTRDMRCGDTTPHVTPGGGGDSACRSRYDGDPYRSRSDESRPPSLIGGPAQDLSKFQMSPIPILSVLTCSTS